MNVLQERHRLLMAEKRQLLKWLSRYSEFGDSVMCDRIREELIDVDADIANLRDSMEVKCE